MKSLFRLGLPSAILLILAGLLLPGCDEDSLADFEPEISNVADTFSLQATGVKNVSLTKDYPWSNTGISANVNQATTISQGSATLRILEDGGTQVYSADLSGNGTFVTSEGGSGTWIVRLILEDYSGTLNFSVEKP